MKRFARILGLAAVLLVPQSALAIVIDFEGFAGPAPLPAGASEDGYLLTDIGAGGVVAPPGFGTPPPAGTSMGFGPGGGGAAPDLELIRIDGELFELIAFDFVFFGGAPTPMTVTGFIAYAQGWGGLYIRANKLAWKQITAHRGLGIPNRFNIPDCPERVHWENDFAMQVGASMLWLRAYKQGPLEWAWRKLTYPRT